MIKKIHWKEWFKIKNEKKKRWMEKEIKENEKIA